MTIHAWYCNELHAKYTSMPLFSLGRQLTVLSSPLTAVAHPLKGFIETTTSVLLSVGGLRCGPLARQQQALMTPIWGGGNGGESAQREQGYHRTPTASRRTLFTATPPLQKITG